MNERACLSITGRQVSHCSLLVRPKLKVEKGSRWSAMLNLSSGGSSGSSMAFKLDCEVIDKSCVARVGALDKHNAGDD